MERASDLLLGVSMLVEPTKTKIIDCAHSAIEELCKMCVSGESLWNQHKDHKYQIINDIEYLTQFGHADATLREIIKLVEVGETQILPSFDSCETNPNFMPRGDCDDALQIEASRDMACVNITPIKLVELLMNVVSVFYSFFFL